LPHGEAAPNFHDFGGLPATSPRSCENLQESPARHPPGLLRNWQSFEDEVHPPRRDPIPRQVHRVPHRGPRPVRPRRQLRPRLRLRARHPAQHGWSVRRSGIRCPSIAGDPRGGRSRLRPGPVRRRREPAIRTSRLATVWGGATNRQQHRQPAVRAPLRLRRRHRGDRGAPPQGLQRILQALRPHHTVQGQSRVVSLYFMYNRV